MNIYEVLEYTVKKARNYGIDEVEVYIVDSLEIQVRGLRKYLEDVITTQSLGLGVRGCIGKKVATQGTTITSTEDVDYVLRTLVKSIKSGSDDPEWKGIPKRLSKSSVDKVFDKEIDYRDVSEYTLKVLEIIKNVESRNTQHLSTDLVISKSRVIIGNNYGEVVERLETHYYVDIEVKCCRNSEETTYRDFTASRIFKELDTNTLIANVVNNCFKFIKPKKIETGIYDIVIKGKIFAKFLEDVLAPAFCADTVQQNRSPLINKIDTQVLNEKLTIIDDGCADGLYASSEFDDEGISTKRKVVIDKGILKTYLYDHYTASREGKESTGNACRRGYSSRPRPWITNLIVKSGRSSFEDLVRDVRKGIVIYDVIGSWLSNPVSGQLTATISHGLYVEKGEVKFPVKGLVINADFYKVFKENVVELSREIESHLNIYAPSIYITNIQVSSEE